MVYPTGRIVEIPFAHPACRISENLAEFSFFRFCFPATMLSSDGTQVALLTCTTTSLSYARWPNSVRGDVYAKHSGFYSTTLDVLLEYLHVDTLIVTGIAANICVLFTANDAYMRDYALYAPEDCVASNTPEETSNALIQMHKVLKADIRDLAEIDFTNLAGIETANRRQPRRGAAC